jgi:Fe-S-cluster containining protein
LGVTYCKGAARKAMGLPIYQAAAHAPAPHQDLPTVRALEDLWREVTARPLWAPPNLLRYLKLRRRTHLKPVDPNQVKSVTPVGQINDCGACSDSCCIGAHNTVLLRLRDIATLVDLKRTALIVSQKPRFSAEVLRARPALRRQVNSETWRRFPVLAQNAFGACQALDQEGRCGLYPHWPMSCARFPMALHLESAEVFFSRRCQSFWIHPERAKDAERIQLAAVASYNERIKDAVLLAYAPQRLQAMGLTTYLTA